MPGHSTSKPASVDEPELVARPQVTHQSASIPIPADTELALRARRLNASVGAEPPLVVLKRAIQDEFAGRIALVSSFGAESAALLHLVASVDPATPVIFLDTGKHFAQTLSYRRKLAKSLGLTHVRDVRPDDNDLSSEDPGGDLWRRSPNACCHLRKTRPLKSVLEGFDAWITGRKQFHGDARAALPVFEAADPFIKVNPIVRWTPNDIGDYVATHDLPAHPLVAEGYPSIGCWPCTHPAASGDGTRAGRWRGLAKTECGIHLL